MLRFDVIIIGTGPAGLSTALHLIRENPSLQDRILMIEKAVHPRHKLCGGGIRYLWLDILRGLDIPIPPPIPYHAVNDARFVYDNFTFHIKNNPEFLVFHRPAFDHYLVQVARERGIQIHEGESVLSIDFQMNEARVETDQATYSAQIIIGADGSKGITRRIAGNTGRNRPGYTARLLETVSPTTDNEDVFLEKYALFDFSEVKSDLQGYIWKFPTQVDGTPHLNQGVYDARYAPSRPKASLPKLLRSALKRNLDTSKPSRFDGHPIHLFTPLNHFSKPRLLLVGDAAGTDPLFGEGIGPALAYGKIAAKLTQSALLNQDFTFTGYRRKILRSNLGSYLLVRWYGAWWGYRFSGQKWFMILLWTVGRLLTWSSHKKSRLGTKNENPFNFSHKR